MKHERLDQALQRLQAGSPLLVTRLRYAGDVILSLPLVHALRAGFPRAPLHYLAEPGPLSLLHGHPDIDRAWEAPRGAVPMLHLLRRLRAQRFAAAIDLFSNPRSAQLVRWSGALLRIGEARRGRRHLYHVQRHLVPGRTAMAQHLAACEVFGLHPGLPAPPRLYLGADELQRGREHVTALRPGESFVLLNLGASHPGKEWPNDGAVELVTRLRRRGIGILLATPPERAAPGDAVMARCGSDRGVVRLPPMDLRAFVAVIAAAPAVVSVDGAVVHAAVALQRPTVALFGPTDAAIWFPYTSFGPYRVVSAPAHPAYHTLSQCQQERCMRAVTPERVEQALLDVLAPVGEAR